LHRVTYDTFDVLAAGEARFDQVLHQGVRPVWSLTWPGITAKTRSRTVELAATAA